MTAGTQLPPLTLSCKPIWRFAFSGAGIVLLALGTAGVASAGGDDASRWVTSGVGWILLAAGAGCAYFAARYCFSHLILNDTGFRLVGPLGRDDVEWKSVVSWARRSGRGGPATLRIVHGEERRRISVPLIYEDSHILEIGLGQRHFPVY